ncbi:hypothetical protein J3R83DRAFT_14057 [Lanmaoa asiatica]|nr:hypothetical protein J3R83DRAFT_14057 [Lanmaoa asiatica]
MPDEPIFENEPDFEGPNFARERQDLINAGLTPALAITSLQTIFRSNKRKERADRERERAEAQIAREEEAERADQLRLQQEEDEEQALKEERKKNKAKFAIIPDTPVPVEPVIVPAHAALRKLKNHQFVDMWYWTNDSLDAADRVKANIPDDSSLALITSEDGTPSFIPSVSAHSKLSVIPDEELSFEQFGQAAIRMITAMRQSNWDPSHINMFISFWRNIETHPWRSSRILRQQKALLVYQGQQRLNWHKTIGSPSAFNLSEINQITLTNTLNDLKDAEDEHQAKLFQEVCKILTSRKRISQLPVTYFHTRVYWAIHTLSLRHCLHTPLPRHCLTHTQTSPPSPTSLSNTRPRIDHQPRSAKNTHIFPAN